MKKFLKVLLIILVIGGAIGATCFFFFKNLQKEKDSFACVNTFIYGVEEEEFDAKMKKAKNYVENYDASDLRFSILIETHNNLIDVAKNLDAYLLNVNTHKIDQNRIVNCVNEIISARDNCASAFAEFFVKCSGAEPSFDKSVAGNQLFKDLTNYIQKYASFVEVLNNEVFANIVFKNADVKFSYFEVYSKNIQAHITEFETVTKTATLKYDKFKNQDFIVTLNSSCNILNGQVVVLGDPYNGNINKFIDFYTNCDADLFALHLMDNLPICVDERTLTTNEAKATYYFAKLFVA